MTVVLYAVTGANGPIAGEGLDERPLRTIREDDLTAVVSDHEASPPPTEPNLWAYEDVVERLMTRTAVLPARFGATASRDEEIRDMLAARHTEFLETLKRVQGAVEIAIRTTSSNAQEKAITGTDYLNARLAERQRARHLTALVDAAVGGLARARTMRPRSRNTLAYLVDAEDVEEFLARLDQLNLPEVTWTGPWPPYSFIEPTSTTRR